MSSQQNLSDTVHDADLRKRVGIALAFTRRPALSRIGIEVANAEVTLHGEVPSQLHRDLAFEIVRRVVGVRRVNVELSLQKADRERSIPLDSTASISVTSTRHFVTTALLWMLAAFSATGCGTPDDDRVQVFPVEGQVQLNGQPLAETFVVFHPRAPQDARTPVARAQTDKEGKFQLTTYAAGDGAAVGEYAVTVQQYKLVQSGDSYAAGPNVLPPKLAAPETTDITVRIAEGPNQLQPIEVQKR